MPEVKATSEATSMVVHSLSNTPASLSSRIFFAPDPRIIGKESRKANRAAFSRVRPSSIPPEIVAPDREVPGISASA